MQAHMQKVFCSSFPSILGSWGIKRSCKLAKLHQTIPNYHLQKNSYKEIFLGLQFFLSLAVWSTYLDSRAEHYRNILDVHFCFQFLCNNMVHMHNQPRNQEMVTLWQLFEQLLALLNFLSFCALSTSIFKAGHELFGKQIFGQFP